MYQHVPDVSTGSCGLHCVSPHNLQLSTMSFKEALEKHPIWFALGLVIVGVTGGAGVAEYLRVTPKIELITKLEREASDLKEESIGARACQSELLNQSASKIDLESKLRETQTNLNQWTASLDQWKNAHAELQRDLNQALANCRVLSLARDVERRKDLAEVNMRRDLNNDASGSKQRVAETRRQVEEYQARLLQLQAKLSCQSGG
jgi:hypothetical protein